MKKIHLWILAIFCVFPANSQSEKAGVRSKRFYDTRNHHISPSQSINPVKYHFCTGVQNMTGACLDEAKCTAEGGVAIGTCKENEGVCCHVVKNSCSASTSSHVVRFQNPSFPKNETEGSSCTLEIKIGRDICVVRMELETFELSPYRKDYCPHDVLVVIGTKKLAGNLCGNMTSMLTSFEVETLSSIKLGILAQGIRPYRYSILLIMIPCQEVVPIRSPINAGIKNLDAQKYTPTTTTTTPKPTTKPSKTTTTPATRQADGPTPLPVGKIRIKPTPDPVVVRKASDEDQNDISLEYDVPTPDSLFQEIFDSKIRELDEGRKGGVPNPESIIREGGDKCYLYDPATGQYRVNEDCAVDDHIHPDGWRIMGGKLANINEYPWQAALIYKTKFFCAGALFSNKFIMTASHCVFGGFKNGIDHLRVSLGDHDMSTKDETVNKLLKIKRVIWNLHYNPLTTENDIAILELAETVEFSREILPINLPTDRSEDYEGTNVTVTGWGRNNLKTRKMSPVLKEFTAPVDNITQCVKKWAKYPRISAIKEMHLCMNITYGTPCHGDSGGPLVSCSKGGYCTAVGVVSFGFPLCRNVGLPAVFTRLTSVMRWFEINTAPVYFESV